MASGLRRFLHAISYLFGLFPHGLALRPLAKASGYCVDNG
jgi:hypothetical protein